MLQRHTLEAEAPDVRHLRWVAGDDNRLWDGEEDLEDPLPVVIDEGNRLTRMVSVHLRLPTEFLEELNYSVLVVRRRQDEGDLAGTVTNGTRCVACASRLMSVSKASPNVSYRITISKQGFFE